MTLCKKLKILQWNCRSFYNKTGLLQNIAHSYDIIILCETWLSQSCTPKVYGFNMITKNRTDKKGGGLAICLKPDIAFKEIPNIYHAPNRLETLAISISTFLGPLIIVSLYKSPGTTVRAAEWHRLFDSLSIPSNVFIGGDFNCHHSSWGCASNCSSGIHLSDTLMDFDLSLLNDGSYTTNPLNPTHNSAALDLSLVSPHLFPVSEWKVESDSLLNDHFPISITLGIEHTTFTFSSHRYPVKKIDWIQFKKSLDIVAPTLANSSPLTQYSNIPQAIHVSINSSIPVPLTNGTRSFKARPTIWWNEECNTANVARKGAWSSFRRLSNLENLIEAKRLGAIARKTFKKTKKNSWIEFTKTIDFRSPTNKVWDKIKRFRNRNIPDATSFRSNTDSHENILNLIPSICPPSCFFPNSPSPAIPCANNPSLDPSFTMEELQAGIHKAKPKSAPGIDKIDSLHHL